MCPVAGWAKTDMFLQDPCFSCCFLLWDVGMLNKYCWLHGALNGDPVVEGTGVCSSRPQAIHHHQLLYKNTACHCMRPFVHSRRIESVSAATYTAARTDVAQDPAGTAAALGNMWKWRFVDDQTHHCGKGSYGSGNSARFFQVLCVFAKSTSTSTHPTGQNP